MPSEPMRTPLGVNVLSSALAGFQVSLFGRIWVTSEAPDPSKGINLLSNHFCCFFVALKASF